MSEDHIPLHVLKQQASQEAMAQEISAVERDLNEERRCLRISSVILAIFETIIVAGLAVFAYFLRYTDAFPVFVREFRCKDPHISFEHNPKIGKHNTISLQNYGDAGFVLVIIFAPFALVVIKELIDCQTDHGFGYGICSKIGATITRSWRVVVSFLFGIFITSIIADATKLSTGRLRPYFLSICTKPCLTTEIEGNTTVIDTQGNFTVAETQGNVTLVDTQSNTTVLQATENSTHTANYDDVYYCFNDVTDYGTAAMLLREARTSFPSSDVMLATFAALFVILYMYRRLKSSCLTMIKSLISSAILVGVILLANSKLVTNQNFLEDVCFSVFLGVIISFYVIFMHLNTFTEKHELLGENSETIIQECHIPRVVYRGSRRAKRNGPERIPPEIRITSDCGVVNPAFRPEPIPITRLSGANFYN